MSADTDVAIMQKGLNDGATFYFVKPMILEILERVWQFALPQNPNRGPAPPFGMLGNENERRDPPNNNNNNINIINNNNNNFPTFLNIFNAREVLRFPQNRVLNQANNLMNHFEVGNVDVALGGRKKPKLIWTTALHNQFLEAVNKIGLDRAVPKKILEYMNVPGLKRENVASHLQDDNDNMNMNIVDLQKYRIFLKRISTQQGIPSNWNDRPFRSSFVLNEISFLTNNLQKQYQQLIGKSHEIGQTSTQVISPGEDSNQKAAAISFPTDIGRQATQGASEIVFNSNNPSSIFAHHQEALSTGSISIAGNFHGGIPTINEEMKNVQCVPTNYVGLRLTSNGELVGTLKDMPIVPEGDDIFANATNSINGANQAANAAHQEVIGNSTYPSDPNAPPNNLFGVENQVNAYVPNLMDIADATQQGPGFGLSQELLSSNHVDQEVFGSDLSFESYNMQGNAPGNVEGQFDLNDDFSLDCYYMQDHGQNFGDFIQDGGFDFTYLD
ncbi:hypothetical protein Cgig2_029975 [Carnegiea gigantea]|uniref:Response regulatory domain-containing protein n=1 Tax=Carnegiea gigantea TaxID=171969 RepID=A0A9Q1K7S0_9CARY|nr:hypothetical protein Cgig2_029975 [Carnegiea gigantea]